jgi:hypothetical protein
VSQNQQMDQLLAQRLDNTLHAFCAHRHATRAEHGIVRLDLNLMDALSLIALIEGKEKPLHERA